MERYVRLNEKNEIVETRDFLPYETPCDIPHKGVRWRPLVKEEVEGMNCEHHDPMVRFVIENDRVRHVHSFKFKPLAVIEDMVRARYRDRIVDALPDLEQVSKIVAEREAMVAETCKGHPDAKG
jgi:hypothetical protein